MMNLIIGSLVEAYFLTGLLLWVRAIMKTIMWAMSTSVPDNTIVETTTETTNKVVEELGSTTIVVVLSTLLAIVAWPKYMKLYEEGLFLGAAIAKEEMNRT